MERAENTVYVLSLSYGKDSLACIEACRRLGYPIDRIVHAEVWATDDIPADLPPMVEFKAKADKIIKDRYGIEVEHVCAMTTPDKKFGGGGYEQTDLRRHLLFPIPRRQAERQNVRLPAYHRRLVQTAQIRRSN